ncbi:MAG: Fis family transcriptional regulator [Deltaproteobacteria bacterium RIFOXYD12_FULL_50_9]|nr:MAG: Fis family transcriptional regulator [Deltaproteobacteria bacterium RIFOXYD12_FULL_50_9]
MATILIVDDELSMREFLKIFLEKQGHLTFTANDGVSAFRLFEQEKIDLVITDIRMPREGGLSLLARIKDVNSSVPVIMITAFASPQDAVLAMKNGAYDYITKPFKVEEVKGIIKAALKIDKTSLPPPASDTGPFQGIIGNSPEILKIFDIIQRIAPTHANVLIHGESGTGKELVARAIHNLSKEAQNPFVPIICSAIPESLFESELFGHVKGAFTGAISSKTGLLELANNGSAFLDEIGELSPMIQTKLLRVLQEREFKPVGQNETVKINVRIISATNKDLEQEVMENRFREDLFYRLAVVPIRVPPLRERKGDVPLLVDYFLNKYSEKFEKNVRGLSSYALEVLMNYDFPGNIRELENIIERGVALENSNIILPESLTLSTHRRKESMSNNLPVPPEEMLEYPEEIYTSGLDTVMARIEKQFIEQALKDADYSKIKAAERLKISFRSLRYKVQKYNINY